MGAWQWRHEIRIADNVTGAGRAAERHSITIVRDELECLCRVVGGRAWLAHWILQKIPTASSRRAGRRNRTDGWIAPPADNIDTTLFARGTLPTTPTDGRSFLYLSAGKTFLTTRAPSADYEFDLTWTPEVVPGP